MIWSKEEPLSREEMEAIQLTRLKDTVKQVWEKVPAYRKKMEESYILNLIMINTVKNLTKKIHYQN